MSIADTTLAKLAEARERHDACLVAFSGGKDALATLDLCSRAGFKRLEAFYMYIVPGLQWVQERIDWASKRWGVEIHQCPHWAVARYHRFGVYRDPVAWSASAETGNGTFGDTSQAVPDLKLDDIYDLMRDETGIRLIATGAKASDGVWRKRHATAAQQDVLWPLWGWNKFDVFGYLKARGIPIPSGDGGQKFSSGEDLSVRYLLWLYDNHQDDFVKVEASYPYVRAVVKRREWYGIAASKG